KSIGPRIEFRGHRKESRQDFHSENQPSPSLTVRIYTVLAGRARRGRLGLGRAPTFNRGPAEVWILIDHPMTRKRFEAERLPLGYASSIRLRPLDPIRQRVSGPTGYL